MAIEVFNRYEHKYLLDKETYEKAIDVMDRHMELDSHNKNHTPYTISNIYFDTDDDYLIRKSLSKPEYKEKLRLRSYGIPEKKSEVFLEIKKKYHGIVNKRRTTLKLDEAYSFLKTGKVPAPKQYMNKQVIKEIDYFLHIHKVKPKLYLAYDRIAYFEKGNPDLRISFDTNIRSRRYGLHLEAGDFGEQLLEKDVYLMEVKTAMTKPLWLTHMLTELQINRCHFSKYGTEFKHYINSERKSIHKILKITIPEDLNYQGAFDDVLQKYTKKYSLSKIRTTDLGSLFELCYDVTMDKNQNEQEFLNDLRCRNGNLNILLAVPPQIIK